MPTPSELGYTFNLRHHPFDGYESRSQTRQDRAAAARCGSRGVLSACTTACSPADSDCISDLGWLAHLQQCCEVARFESSLGQPSGTGVSNPFLSPMAREPASSMPISPSRAVLRQHNTGQRRRLWRDYGALKTGLRAVGGVPTSTAMARELAIFGIK